MTTATHVEQTYLPAEHGDEIARVFDFLAAHEGRHGTRPTLTYFLAGPEPGDRVELPAEIHRVLVQVVEALRAGKAVTVAPRDTRLTTQQAAELINVSRPTLVKLLENGAIPFERISSRRMVRLADVLAYRLQRREAQYAALAATSSAMDEDTDPESVRQLLAEARAAVAVDRRKERTYVTESADG